MKEYNPKRPSLTLKASILSSTSYAKYEVNDDTGLGPFYPDGVTAGADVSIQYEVVINNIGSQTVGDASLRQTVGTGANKKGQYNGIDIKVGDFVASDDGTKVLKIISISEKSSTQIKCILEDTGLSVARSSNTKSNEITDGTSVVIFEVSEDNQMVLATDKITEFGSAQQLAQVDNYFKSNNTYDFTFTNKDNNDNKIQSKIHKFEMDKIDNIILLLKKKAKNREVIQLIISNNIVESFMKEIFNKKEEFKEIFKIIEQQNKSIQEGYDKNEFTIYLQKNMSDVIESLRNIIIINGGTITKGGLYNYDNTKKKSGGICNYILPISIFGLFFRKNISLITIILIILIFILTYKFLCVYHSGSKYYHSDKLYIQDKKYLNE